MSTTIYRHEPAPVVYYNEPVYSSGYYNYGYHGLHGYHGYPAYSTIGGRRLSANVISEAPVVVNESALRSSYVAPLRTSYVASAPLRSSYYHA
jgi:hypothetical protein